jgi:hypothetical protein
MRLVANGNFYILYLVGYNKPKDEQLGYGHSKDDEQGFFVSENMPKLLNNEI